MKDRLYSRGEIEDLIANGRTIVILDGQVIKADAWVPYHPGGVKAIQHMVGRDGTDEIRAFHGADTQIFMKKFIIGRIEGKWDNFLPPIQGGIFRKLEEQQLDEQLFREDQIVDGSSSSNSTASPSPIFETLEGLRHRRAGSTSSLSSLSLPEEMEQPGKPTTMDDLTSAMLKEDLAKYPPVSAETQWNITQKYRQLEARIAAAGLYKCPYGAYGIEALRYSLLFGLFVLCLRYGQYALSGVFLGLFWHQLVFTAHDAGHIGITHIYHVDATIGIFVADFLGGLSIGWWKRSHNVHHLVTNSPEHDPDIELMPFFAISHQFFSSVKSTYYDRILDFDVVAQTAIKFQHWLYYPILALGRFNLYCLSWVYLLSSTQAVRKGPAWWHCYFELVGQCFFWYWFGYLTLYRSIPTWSSRIAFVLISHMMTGPLHVQITLSHFAMSTADLGVTESFAQKMLRTTMDVDCPTWLDFFHGGLQFQAVHHLFPRIPRHNLRAAQKFVIEFCEEVNIPYTIYGFGRGNKEVLGRLGEVAKQLEMFEECQRHAAKELLEGHVH